MIHNHQITMALQEIKPLEICCYGKRINIPLLMFPSCFISCIFSSCFIPYKAYPTARTIKSLFYINPGVFHKKNLV